MKFFSLESLAAGHPDRVRFRLRRRSRIKLVFRQFLFGFILDLSVGSNWDPLQCFIFQLLKYSISGFLDVFAEPGSFYFSTIFINWQRLFVALISDQLQIQKWYKFPPTKTATLTTTMTTTTASTKTTSTTTTATIMLINLFAKVNQDSILTTKIFRRFQVGSLWIRISLVFDKWNRDVLGLLSKEGWSVIL